MGQTQVIDRHIMVDIETLANESAYPLITSVALVEFDMVSGEILDTFQINIDVQSSINEGFEIAGSNIQWWTETDEKVSVLRSILNTGTTIREALHLIDQWFNSKNMSEVHGIWGNSNRFDLGILGRAFHKIYPKRGYPWMFYTERDVRTLMDFYPMFNRITGKNLPDYKRLVLDTFTGDAHNPLQDCFKQIEYVVMFMKDIRNRLLHEDYN